jgi:hypothetical protein
VDISLLSCCLAKTISSGSIIPTFGCHVTICNTYQQPTNEFQLYKICQYFNPKCIDYTAQFTFQIRTLNDFTKWVVFSVPC